MPTFNLSSTTTPRGARCARIRAHLEPDGSALIPLFVPSPMPPEALGAPRTHVTEDGRTMRFTVVSVDA